MNGAMLVPEFDVEMANTRRALERIPEDRLDFKPHERSYSLLELAGHLSNLPQWTGLTLTTTEIDMDGPFERDEPTTKEAILAEFDANVAEARPILEGMSAEEFMVPWSLKMRGEVAFTMPRIAVFRSFIMNHNIHHRGQLTVYLRLLDVPVPAIYGPSADEQ